MKNSFFLFLVALLGGVQGVFAQVTNVNAAQVGKNIVLTYDLDRTADISVECSIDGGRTYTTIRRVSGDVGQMVNKGHNTITWDVLAEQDNLIGDKICFRVNATTGRGTANGHEWVDLGLSVKWATCNVGATKPESYGYYYAWGEIFTKRNYNWNTYKWCNGSFDTQTKYCTQSRYSYVTVDNKIQLELADDAARVNWGGQWRMPTDAEWTELRTKCTWTWTTRNGVKGYMVKSNINGNSIFLPAAGYRNSNVFGSVGYYGYYWSSSLDPDYPFNSWYMHFNLDGVYRYNFNRYCGLSVRPVLGE